MWNPPPWAKLGGNYLYENILLVDKGPISVHICESTSDL